MSGLIWLFFIIAIVWVMYWYLQNSEASGLYDKIQGRFAMKDEEDQN